MVVLLLALSCSNSVYAGVSCGEAISDNSTTVTPLPDVSAGTATASLSLSNPNMTSRATTGSIATASTNISVSVSDAEDYSLILSVDNTVMANGDTIISAGDVISANTWGYKWDNATSYIAPTTAGSSLNVPALANNTATFTKELVFGVNFSDEANPGHYEASGTLSLVATPKIATLTLANLTEMQQITPQICEDTPYLNGLNYSAEYILKDVRDGQTYTVRKLGDGKCWMTQNLAIHGGNNGGICSWRVLKPATSDVTTNWDLPAAYLPNKFNDNASADLYISGSTGYYTWCAATAGTCSSATNQGAHVSSSICPKGWRLPGGYNDKTYGNEFYTLFDSMSLGITLNTSGNTSWNSTQLNIAQGSPYNFAYTGVVNGGNFYDPSSYQNGGWWSSTAGVSTVAYRLFLDSSLVYPGTYNDSRYVGFAVRCVAR